MTRRLRRITGSELIRILRRHGFEVFDQRGSHVHLKDARGTRLTVPVHAGRTIGPGLLLAIVKHAGIDPDTLR